MTFAETLAHKRIFVVEDNIENRNILKILLRELRVTLEFDAWGRDTLWRLKNFLPVDLVLMDLMLPGGLSGYDVFTQIHNQPEFSKLPIVAVSAADPSHAIPRCQAAGFAGFIAKPIDIDTFPALIEKVLNGTPVWHTGTAFSEV